MSVIVPLRNDLPFYDLQVSLDGTTYTLELRWNVRMQAWFMNVYDETGETLIRAGLRLVVDFPIDAYNTARQPPGLFWLRDTSGQGLEPGQNDLGDRCQLYYFLQSEIAPLV